MRLFPGSYDSTLAFIPKVFLHEHEEFKKNNFQLHAINKVALIWFHKPANEVKYEWFNL